MVLTCWYRFRGVFTFTPKRWFFLKIAGAPLCHIMSYKKKHSYIMRRSVHQHHKINTHNITLHPSPPVRGVESKPSKMCRRYQRCATTNAATRCNPERVPELPNHETVASSRIGTIVDPCAPIKL